MVACLASASPASAADKVRTIGDIHSISKRVLKRTVSRPLYRELLVSPIEAWIAVRGQLSGTHVYGARVIHSEASGAYDKYALQLARDWQIAGKFGLGKIGPTNPILLNVLIFQIADGTMAVSFPTINEPGGEQLEYYGAAKFAVEQSDGSWRDLDLPQGPLKGVWAVRQGLANNFDLEMRLQQFSNHR